MKYCWKLVMTSGKEYVVVNETKSLEEFIKFVSEPSSKVTVSVHDLRDRGNVVIYSNQIVSIEFNYEM